jgi:hypothetical protein
MATSERNDKPDYSLIPAAVRDIYLRRIQEGPFKNA